MTQPQKLMFVITDLVYGGGQTVIVKLLPHIDRTKFSPCVVTLSGGNSDLVRQIKSHNVPVVDLNMHKWWVFPAAWRFYRLLKHEGPQVLHASLFHATVLSRLVGRLARVPVIVSWRQNISLGAPWRDRIYALTARLDDHVVAVCQPAKRAEIDKSDVRPDQITVIPNCVDINQQQVTNAVFRDSLRSELAIPPTDKMILSVGRLHPQKGFRHLLDAFPAVLAQVPRAKLVLVGEGALEVDLKAQCQKLGISDRVLFTGRRHDIPALMAAADLFVLPSLWEGLPLVVLEALAAKLPVIATDVGGTSEAIIDEETGLLMQSANVDQIVEKLLTLLLNPQWGQQLATAGYERVIQRFSAPSVAQRLETLYLDLIN